MENLLTPNPGLIIWTWVTFLILVFVLGKTAWKPLLKVLEERENKIKDDLAAAAKAKDEMERMKAQFDSERLEAEAKTQSLLNQARDEAGKVRDEIVKTAQAEAKNLLEKTKKQLEEEKERLSKELRNEVAGISLAAAEKILKKNLDQKSNEKLVEEFLENLPKS